jgi:23S rRNA pseudouridine2605 synthase
VPAERLQKIIAAAGIASRRHAEELITQGRVSVNGQVVTELGSKADPQTDHIKVDGKLLHAPERHVYLLLNKPKGYVTTVSDPEGRPTVMELVKNVDARVYPVGRLDYLSEGLLLMTNDGELANHLMKAASHVAKTYLVKVAGQPKEGDIERLRRGIRLSAKQGERTMHAVNTAPAQIRQTREGDNPWYEVTLIEGKNRQIRRMFEEIGHHVEKIKRVRYGALTLDVEPGEFRELTPREVYALRKPGEKQMPKEKERKPRFESKKNAARRADRPRRNEGTRGAERPLGERLSRIEKPRNTGRPGKRTQPQHGGTGGPRTGEEQHSAHRPLRSSRPGNASGPRNVNRPFDSGKSAKPHTARPSNSGRPHRSSGPRRRRD